MGCALISGGESDRSGDRVVATRLQSEMVVKKQAGEQGAEEPPLSLAEKGVTAAEARLRRNLLGPLIKYIFNLFFVATLAAYVFTVLWAFNYCPLLLALVAVGVASPYFIMMLIALPFLKEVYIEQYGNAAVWR